MDFRILGPLEVVGPDGPVSLSGAKQRALLLYAMAPVEASFCAVARVLGVLATMLRRFDEAERHFEEAIDIERRMRARPWIAHAQHDYGVMLLARGDAGRATALLDEAVATYRQLGMDSWAARAGALTEPARTLR